MGHWCILQTQGRSTLRLAAALADDGMVVWTPALTVIKRVPRCNVKREVTLPLLSGFVFAGARHLWTLVDKAEDPGRRFSFSVLRCNDRYPLVPDAELEPLRAEERRVVPRDKAKVYAFGDEVQAPLGAFGGMTGAVIRSNARKTLVLMSGSRRVEFFTFDLQPIQAISRTQAQMGIAA